MAKAAELSSSCEIMDKNCGNTAVLSRRAFVERMLSVSWGMSPTVFRQKIATTMAVS